MDLEHLASVSVIFASTLIKNRKESPRFIDCWNRIGFYILILVVETLGSNGTVVIPCSAFDDLFANIADCFKGIGSRFNGLSVHVVSPVAKHSLHLSNIFSEW
jgi:hypothetical protein